MSAVLIFSDITTVDWNQAITIEDVRQPYPETRYITYTPINDPLCVFAWVLSRNKPAGDQPA